MARPMTQAEVVETRRLTPTMVRLRLSAPGGGPLPIEYSGHTDSYIKLVLPRPGSGVQAPFDPDEVKERLEPHQWPVQRAYTIRSWDEATGIMTVDVVVHGDEGIAGPWADSARPGDRVQFVGPGGAYRPNPDADWHLLVGDESALPAIAAAAESLPPDARVVALVEVADGEEEQPVSMPAAGELRWVRRCDSDRAAGIDLVQAVRDLPFPSGRVHAFVHGDATTVREIRSYLRFEQGVPKEDLSASGYWRRGMDDEAWRAVKREWAAQIEADEAAHV